MENINFFNIIIAIIIAILCIAIFLILINEFLGNKFITHKYFILKNNAGEYFYKKETYLYRVYIYQYTSFIPQTKEKVENIIKNFKKEDKNIKMIKKIEV